MSAIFHVLFKSRAEKLKEQKAAVDAEIALLDLEREVVEKERLRDKKREELARLKSGQPPSQRSRPPKRGN
jgi:hypothetical protein